jgi:hypothetical protein
VRRRLPVALAACLALATALPATLATAQGSGSATAAVTLSPVGDSTVSGLAVLTPRDADTAANVVALGAPAGAMAVVHAGTCTAIDPTPVGLLGDVGTTGQLATTVPLAFGDIADGGHVVAIHPGLDLSTALACGAIPQVATGPDGGPSAAPGASVVPGSSDSPASGRFDGARFGFAIDWDDPWQRQEWDPGEGYEGLYLSNGTSSVSFVAFELPGGDATACIRDWEGRLLGLLRAGTVADLQPVTDAEQPGDAERAVGSYQYLYKTQDDPAGSTIIERDECRRLSDSSVIEVTSDIPAASHDTEAPLVTALVARLTTTGTPSGSGGPPPSAAPTTPTTPTAPPTPVVTAPPTPAPLPTPDPACEGVDAWVRDTLARFDAAKGIADEIGTSMNAGMAAYAQALSGASLAIQQLQIAQQQAVVPSAAAAAQADVIKMFQKLAEAYDLMGQAYTTGNTGVLQQGLSAASEAQGLAATARTGVRNAATPCGISVPAA